MRKLDPNSERQLEVILVLTTLATACIMSHVQTSQFVILNLFFLPVILAGFFLGRYRAGIMAFLSVVTATIVVAMDVDRFVFQSSPLMVVLSVMIWGAVLGLAALLLGTLSDDRNARATEAHEAHLGVVEVLARYLQSADVDLHAQSMRIVELSELIAARMRLTRQEIDDLRIAAMLMDVENIEITARVIRKAVGQFDEGQLAHATIHGTELVESLRNTLSGASPLLASSFGQSDRNLPLSARILRTVRSYVELEAVAAPNYSPSEFALDMLQRDERGDSLVLGVLEEVLNEDKNAQLKVISPQKLDSCPVATI